MKRFVSLILIVYMAVMPLVMTGCSNTAENGDIVKIGVIASMTGSVAAYSESAVNGINLAVEEINSTGGVLDGKKMEITLLDDKSDSTEAANCYNRLVEQNVSTIIGSITSGITAGVASLAHDDQMLLITPTGTSDEITKDRPTVFRTCYRDSYQSAICAQFLKDSLGVTKVGILYAAGDAYSAGMKDGFKTKAETLGLEVLIEESASSAADTDYSAQLTNIAAAGVEAIFVPFYYDVMAPYIVPQARAAGYAGVIVGADGYDGMIDYMVTDKSLYNHVFFTNHYAADDPSERVQSFVTAYNSRYRATPNAFAALGYDTVYMLRDAIEAAGSTETAALVNAMSELTFDCVTGKFQLDTDGNPSKPCAIIEYKDGAMVWKDTVG